MPSSPCHEECKYLVKLANRLEESMRERKEGLGQWYNKANSLLQSPGLESLQGELELEQLSLQLRTEWLRYANHVSSRYLKSPPSAQPVYMPSGNVNTFPYDRWIGPRVLEKRAFSYHPAPSGWKTDHVMFNSGMGAMTCMLQVLRSLFQPRAGSPLRLHGVGGYFEIMDLMSISRDDLFHFLIFDDQKAFQKSVAQSGSQLLYIEPVATTFGLGVFDLEGFLQAWNQRSGQLPTMIVFDTTVVGNTFPIEEALTRLKPSRPGVVIQISSNLKLDQEGLEFSNAGLMTVYSTNKPDVDDIAMRMRKYRANLGLGLTMEQIAALDYPGFLDREITDYHCDNIFRNNAHLARLLEVGDSLLFASKSHPTLQEQASFPWTVAPFVYVRLRKGCSAEDRVLLKHVFTAEASRRNLAFQPGSSFGFRAHRCEMGGIRDIPGVETIRFSMGCRNGPSTNKLIEFLNELSHMKSIEKVGANFPDSLETARQELAAKRDLLGHNT